MEKKIKSERWIAKARNFSILCVFALMLSACAAAVKTQNDINESVKTDVIIPKMLTIAAVGDIMLGTNYPSEITLPPNDGAGLLDEAAPFLRAADVTIGNLEGAMTDGGKTNKCKRGGSARCFTFRMPTRFAALLKEAGFNVMNLANNHAYDFGANGAASARRALDEQNITHTGEVGDIAKLSARDFNVSVIGFAPNANMHNINDLNETARLVSREALVSDIVIVVFHGGAEGGDKTHVIKGHEFHLGEDRGDLIAFAHTAIDAGADLVIGHGPHVPRGIEIYKERLIAYSLGNFATWKMMNLSGFRALAPILEVTLDSRGSFTHGYVRSAIQIKPGGPRIDPTNAAAHFIRDMSIDDFTGSAPKFTDDGGIFPPQELFKVARPEYDEIETPKPETALEDVIDIAGDAR
jgi:poly-gamma-glutamate capsule biosynthesis protein CapA/YwtB (metallophosphatase superfamily)